MNQYFYYLSCVWQLKNKCSDTHHVYGHLIIACLFLLFVSIPMATRHLFHSTEERNADDYMGAVVLTLLGTFAGTMIISTLLYTVVNYTIIVLTIVGIALSMWSYVTLWWKYDLYTKEGWSQLISNFTRTPD